MKMEVALDRRSLLKTMSAGGALALLPATAKAAVPAAPAPSNLAAAAVPISQAERLGRMARLQAGMRKAGIGATLVEAGSALVYFTGVQWWRSERVTAVIIPADGEAIIVTPFFEAPSIAESLAIPANIRTWDEHDNPMALVAGWLKEKKLANRPVAMEETVREFIRDGLQKQLPSARIISGAPVIRAVRMRKSPAEIALMQIANNITLNAIRATAAKAELGMTPADIRRLMGEATRAQGASGGEGLVLLGEAAAYPHGSKKPQQVRPGEPILIDAGCQVEGYTSDISRTFFVGEPSAEVRKVWTQVRQGQQIGFEAAQLGKSCGSVDDAVRGEYEKWGYGPGYKLPGLSHRTGHGIGMDGHEPVNLVHGETTPLDVGMCFSNEPGIYLPGKFGVRLEDCFYMTAQGPKYFTEPPATVDNPV